mmetsp:Transcript_35834/g.80695  ORF Transcript_35834/g.80695 Transcript_35834/m.80695 type:complete len:992 (+) Transcript_35834:2-2977(+)
MLAAVGQALPEEPVSYMLAYLRHQNVPRGTALHAAAAAADAAAVKAALIKSGHYVNQADEEGYTPLHLAARSGNKGVVLTLLQSTASPNAPDNRELTALHMAAQCDHASVVLVLVKNDARLDVGDCSGRTPLHIAVEFSSTKALTTLLDKMANPNIGNHRDMSPLHLAAERAYGDGCSALLAAKAIPTKANMWSQTARDLANEAGDEECAALLALGTTDLMLGAREGKQLRCAVLLDKQASPNVENELGYTALSFAVQRMQYPTVELLLQRSGDLNSMVSFRGNARIDLLEWASLREDARLLQLLVAAGADLDCRFATSFVALHLGAMRRSSYMRELLTHRACPNTQDDTGRTPLMLCMAAEEEEAGRVQRVETAQQLSVAECMSLLVQHEADVGLLDTQRRTALHYAAALGDGTASEMLLRSRAQPDALDSENNTPMHMAVAAGHTSVVELLCQVKADVNIPNRQGLVVLHLASDKLVGDLLLRQRADIDKKDKKQGWSALTWAVSRGLTDLVALFISRGSSVTDEAGSAAFSVAREKGDAEMRKLLESAGQQELSRPSTRLRARARAAEGVGATVDEDGVQLMSSAASRMCFLEQQLQASAREKEALERALEDARCQTANVQQRFQSSVDEVRELQSKLLMQVGTHVQRLEETSLAVGRDTGELGRVERANAALTERNAVCEKEREEAVTLKDLMEAQLSVVQQAASEAEEANRVLREHQDELQAQIHTLLDEVETLRGGSAGGKPANREDMDLEEERKKAKAQLIERTFQNLQLVSAEKQILEDEKAALLLECEHRGLHISELEGKLYQLHEAHAALQRQATRLADERPRLIAMRDRAEQRMEQFKEQSEIDNNQRRQLEGSNAYLKESMERSEQLLKQMEEEVERAEFAREQLEQEATTLRERLGRSQKFLRKLTKAAKELVRVEEEEADEDDPNPEKVLPLANVRAAIEDITRVEIVREEADDPQAGVEVVHPEGGWRRATSRIPS